MVGPFNTPDSPAPDPLAEVAPTPEKTGLAAFISTTAGRLVIGGIALALVLVALGIIAVVFLFSGKPSGEQVIIPVTGSKNATGAAEIKPVRRPDPALQDSFTFRNIFQPTIKPVITVEAESSGTSGTVNGIKVPDDTLFLESVAVENDEQVAKFIWNGQSYTAKEGMRLGTTPWKVLTIQGNTVDMIYGESRVTLVVGQGLGK